MLGRRRRWPSMARQARTDPAETMPADFAPRPARPLMRAAATARSMLERWPSRCFVCGIHRAQDVCDGCRADFFSAEAPRCRLCAARLPRATASALCARCLHEPPHFDATVTVGDYRPPLDGLVLALKYGHRLAVARLLGRLLSRRACGIARDLTVVVAVPLALARQSERGFNQAHEIARQVARDLDRPLRPDLLRRVRHGPPQEALTRAARAGNVRGAFAVHGDVRGARVAVVDDVMTSGATLNEVARALKAAGAAAAVNLIVARTP
jgi:ComF family protein